MGGVGPVDLPPFRQFNVIFRGNLFRLDPTDELKSGKFNKIPFDFLKNISDSFFALSQRPILRSSSPLALDLN